MPAKHSRSRFRKRRRRGSWRPGELAGRRAAPRGAAWRRGVEASDTAEPPSVCSARGVYSALRYAYTIAIVQVWGLAGLHFPVSRPSDPARQRQRNTHAATPTARMRCNARAGAAPCPRQPGLSAFFASCAIDALARHHCQAALPWRHAPSLRGEFQTAKAAWAAAHARQRSRRH